MELINNYDKFGFYYIKQNLKHFMVPKNSSFL